MQSTDLFGNQVKDKVTEIEIFADEIKPFNNRIRERWLYIAVLIVPVKKKRELLERLTATRRKTQCDSEIKCHDLDESSKRELAKKWLDVVLRDKDTRSIFFNILGINLSNLNLAAFGRKAFEPVYNRFFRSCVLSCIKRCFPKRHVRVSNIFHDKGDQSRHAFFPWHCIYSIEGQTSEVTFANKEIVFINSDHRESDGSVESHIVQLIDLIVGLTSHCLDCVSTNKARTFVAKDFIPLLERMMNNPGNKNSKYGYFGKYLISFFPSKKLSTKQLQDAIEREKSGFYHKRPLLLAEKLSNQESLLFPV